MSFGPSRSAPPKMDPRSAREVLFEIVTVEVTFIEETTGGFPSSESRPHVIGMAAHYGHVIGMATHYGYVMLACACYEWP